MILKLWVSIQCIQARPQIVFEIVTTSEDTNYAKLDGSTVEMTKKYLTKVQ